MGEEARAYRAASDSLEGDLRQLEKIKEQLNRLEQVRWERPDPPVVESFRAADGTTWHVYVLRTFLTSYFWPNVECSKMLS